MNKYRIMFGILVMLLLINSQTSHVAAANNQGLEWGFDVDDRFDYNVEVTFQNTTLDLAIDDEMYVIIDDLPIIADDIAGFGQLVLPSTVLGHFTTYWVNGTVMDDFWEKTMKMNPFKPLPVGNWNLITQLWEANIPVPDLAQDSLTMTYTFEDLPNPGNNQTAVNSKIDGAPTYFLYNVTWGSETTVFVEVSREIPTSTTGSPTGTTTPDGDNTLLLVLGGSAAVVVVVLILVIMRRR
jgi:hypothetical protein